ncbi:MAG: mechanosensitive ion channel family protein [Segetibacter sp.]
MKESFKGVSNRLLDALQNYWNGFIVALPRFALAVLLFAAIVITAIYVSRLINKKLGGKSHDPLFVRFISKLTKFALIVIGVIISLQVMGLSGIAGGLLAGAGVSAFIFGFAFKDIAENFLAGIILAFNRPFSLGDTIMIKEYTGHVTALNFRTTHIKTFDEKDVFLPNAIVIKEPVTNFTSDGLLRLDFSVGIAYEDDIAGATEIILAAVNKSEGLAENKDPFAVVEELAVSTVNLRVYFWTTTDDYKKGVLLIKSKIVSNVKEALTDKGYTMPADILELKVYDKRESLPLTVLSQPPAAKE